jgi:hypothetical protein
MHTSAPTLAEYTGTLLQAAQSRTSVVDHDGHMVPVLVLDIELDNSFHTPLQVEYCFPAGHQVQAQAAAHRYKKGLRITVQVPLLTLRMGGIAAHIHTHKPETPCRP